MANATFNRRRKTGLTCLVLCFLIGSGVWLKLILSDVLATSPIHELLYEREYEPGAHWHVARNLSIWTNLTQCDWRPRQKNRLLGDGISDSREDISTDSEYSHGRLDTPAGEEELDLASNQLTDLLSPITATGGIGESQSTLQPVFGNRNATAPPNPPSIPRPQRPPPPPPPSPMPSSPSADSFGCDFGARMTVYANLGVVEKNVGPLYFVVYASADWKKWWQASHIDYQTSRFVIKTDPSGNQHWSTVKAKACIQIPSFIYLIGCVVEGSSAPSVVAPPFHACVALDGVCGPACGSGVHEPSHNDASKPGYLHPSTMHCVKDDEHVPQIPLGDFKPGTYSKPNGYQRVEPEPGTLGKVRLDDIEMVEHNLVHLRPASYLFSIMYLIGVLSLFLVYVPSIGQCEGVQPTWKRLKETHHVGTTSMNSAQSKEMREFGAAPLRQRRASQTVSRRGTSTLTGDNTTPFITDLESQPSVMHAQAADERGMVVCAASISATEPANIILRNALGKVAANLRLLVEVRRKSDRSGQWIGGTPTTIIDVFIDEGHRLGAYYLYKAIALTFYVCIPAHIAMKIASEWLKRMNKSDGARDTDKFAKLDLFSDEFLGGEFLTKHAKRRSEIKLLELVHTMFKSLNQLHEPMERQRCSIFDRILDMPVLSPSKQAEALSQPALFIAPIQETEEEEAEEAQTGNINGSGCSSDTSSSSDGGGENGASGVFSPLTADQLRQQRQPELDRPRDDDEYSTASTIVGGNEQKPSERLREVLDIEPDVPLDAVMAVLTLQFRKAQELEKSKQKDEAEKERRRAITLRDLLELLIEDSERSSNQHRENAPSSGGPSGRTTPNLRDTFCTPGIAPTDHRSFFNPLLWQRLGRLIVNAQSGSYKTKGDREIPEDVPAYYHALVKLGQAANEPILDSVAWLNLRPLFSRAQKEALLKLSENTKRLAFDLVENMMPPLGSSFEPSTHAHLAPDECVLDLMAVYAARGKPTLYQGWTMPNHRRVVAPGVWVCKKAAPRMRPSYDYSGRKQDAQHYWESRRQIARLLDQSSAHFFDDDECDNEPSPEHIEDINDFCCLNMHLGKAGGLNFGLNAVAMLRATAEQKPLSPTNPMFFGIVDARHAVDERYWLHVLPPFFHADDRNDVSFQHDIALVQLAHHYLGMTHSTDPLDMGNDFMFTGMAVIRDQCYGMTSCGTGGVWSVTRDIDGKLDEFFFGRTMIEDTASSIVEFLNGRKAMYVAPFADKPPHDQLMCAVPKVSANYLEALERWDKGAIQCLCSLALDRPWFWVMQLLWCIFAALIVLPAWTSLAAFQHVREWNDFVDLFGGEWWLEGDGLNISLLIVIASAFGWLVLVVVVFVLLHFAPRTLNYSLRMSILYFNVTYPINCISSIFWIAMPPWIAIGGKFPFRFNPIFAILGSLMLRLIEWGIVMQVKAESIKSGTLLKEYSIFRSQQMNEVTVPIKMRAVVLGFISGLYDDVYLKKDNSFWTSFGSVKQAVVWVQVWLALCMLAMFAAIGGGIFNLVTHWDDKVAVAASVFGMVLAVLQIWILAEPTLFVLRDRKFKVSMRHTEVLVLIAIGLFVLLSTQGNIFTFKAFNPQ